jgi:hypothetical protein
VDRWSVRTLRKKIDDMVFQDPLDRHERQPGEDPPIGLILCAGKSDERIELLELESSGTSWNYPCSISDDLPLEFRRLPTWLPTVTATMPPPRPRTPEAQTLLFCPFMKTSLNTALFGIAAGAALLAACETSHPSDDVVGTWQRMRDDATVRDQYVFGADGSLSFDEFKPDDPASEDHVVGTFTATDDTLVVTGTNAKNGARSQGTVTYYANATLFATQALRPTGSHSGIVGEWTATVKATFPDEPTRPAEGGDVTYQFRADGTFTANSNSAGGTAVTEQGTYHEDTPGVFQIIPAGETAGRSLQMIDDAALVFPTRIFQRS